MYRFNMYSFQTASVHSADGHIFVASLIVSVKNKPHVLYIAPATLPVQFGYQAVWTPIEADMRNGQRSRASYDAPHKQHAELKKKCN